MNLPLIIKEYVLKMLNEASGGMKAFILDDFTVSAVVPHLLPRIVRVLTSDGL